MINTTTTTKTIDKRILNIYRKNNYFFGGCWFPIHSLLKLLTRKSSESTDN